MAGFGIVILGVVLQTVGLVAGGAVEKQDIENEVSQSNVFTIHLGILRNRE